MGKVVKQYRYYEDGHLDNRPFNLSYQELTGINDQNQYSEDRLFFINKAIYQLGIQAIPGTMFYINDSDNPCIVGITGMYEIPIDSKLIVSKIRFDTATLDVIRDNVSSVLIVDTVEEG